MKRLKRYTSALTRYHKSNGFGIHSPFAFNFVTKVLRERLPFYCYAELEVLRKMAIKSLSQDNKHPKIISLKSAKLLFRVTNYFNPRNILQIGTNYGISSITMLHVSSQSNLVIYYNRPNQHCIST